MVKNVKHMTKKELQEDPFFHEVAHVVDFYKRNKNTLIIGFALIVILVFGMILFNNISEKDNRAASGYFGIAMDHYQKGQMQQAEEYFLLTSEEFSSNVWGKRSLYYLGLIHRDEPEGIDYLNRFVESDCKQKPLLASAWQLIGARSMMDGDFSVAGDCFVKAAENAINTALKTDYAVRAVSAYSQAGDETAKEKSIGRFETMGLDESQMDRITAAAM